MQQDCRRAHAGAPGNVDEPGLGKPALTEHRECGGGNAVGLFVLRGRLAEDGAGMRIGHGKMESNAGTTRNPVAPKQRIARPCRDLGRVDRISGDRSRTCAITACRENWEMSQAGCEVFTRVIA